MSAAWNPFDPDPEATRLALDAYWEARQRVGVYNTFTIKEQLGREAPRRQLTNHANYENRRVEFGLEEFPPAHVARIPIPKEYGPRRRQKIQQVRMSVAIMHHTTDRRFKTRSHDDFIQVERIA